MTVVAELTGRRPPGWLVAAGRLAGRVVPLVAVGFAVLSWVHLPSMSLTPALIGLGCWTVGTYLFCPLRWRAVSFEQRSWRWHARVYGEGELLGLLTPQHAGMDLWRIRQLVAAGTERRAAVMEIATDRATGGVALLLLAATCGGALPLGAVPAVAAGVFGVLGLLVATRRLWLPRLRAAPLPPLRRVAKGAAMSFLFQAGYLGFIIGVVAAVGHSIDPLSGAGLLGLSQLAGLLPGVHGAGPKEGAMAGGLVALGVPIASSLAAVGLVAALAWVPAVAVGGTGLAARSLRRRGA